MASSSSSAPANGINANDMMAILQVFMKLKKWHNEGKLTNPGATTWTIGSKEMYMTGLISKAEKKKGKRYSFIRQVVRADWLLRQHIYHGWATGEMEAFKKMSDEDEDFLNVEADDVEEKTLDAKDD
jgi:hypothetical protein